MKAQPPVKLWRLRFSSRSAPISQPWRHVNKNLGTAASAILRHFPQVCAKFISFFFMLLAPSIGVIPTVNGALFKLGRRAGLASKDVSAQLAGAGYSPLQTL